MDWLSWWEWGKGKGRTRIGNGVEQHGGVGGGTCVSGSVGMHCGASEQWPDSRSGLLFPSASTRSLSLLLLLRSSLQLFLFDFWFRRRRWWFFSFRLLLPILLRLNSIGILSISISFLLFSYSFILTQSPYLISLTLCLDYNVIGVYLD